MQSLEKPLTNDELRKLDELLHSDELFEVMVEKAVRGRRTAGRRTSLEGLLERLDETLRRRATRASVRSPETLSDELDNLNLVLELKERIGPNRIQREGD